MLVAGALALLIFVVAAIAALLAVDLGRTEHRHWLDALKSWQQLIGAVLGFLGAAGVLVLSTAISQDNDIKKSAAASHAIGLGLALEVERMGTGLRLGKAIGATIDLSAPAEQLARTCVNYSTTLQSHLLKVTPVYDAVLPRMVDFGDENLAIFVRFYGFFYDFQQALKEVDQSACDAAAADEITYIQHQIAGGMGYYKLISDNYPIAAADIDATQPASPPSNTPSSAPISSP
ncbi:MAG: hypothetical protein ABI398_09075 [Devosia sp.]